MGKNKVVPQELMQRERIPTEVFAKAEEASRRVALAIRDIPGWSCRWSGRRR